MSPPCPGCPPRSPTPWQWPLTGLSDLLLPPRAPCKQQPHHLTWLSRKKLPGGSHHWQKVASPSGRPMGPRPICPFPCRSSPTVLGSSATLFPLPRHTVCTPRGPWTRLLWKRRFWQVSLLPLPPSLHQLPDPAATWQPTPISSFISFIVSEATCSRASCQISPTGTRLRETRGCLLYCIFTASNACLSFQGHSTNIRGVRDFPSSRVQGLRL